MLPTPVIALCLKDFSTINDALNYCYTVTGIKADGYQYVEIDNTSIGTRPCNIPVKSKYVYLENHDSIWRYVPNDKDDANEIEILKKYLNSDSVPDKVYNVSQRLDYEFVNCHPNGKELLERVEHSSICELFNQFSKDVLYNRVYRIQLIKSKQKFYELQLDEYLVSLHVKKGY